MHEGLKLYIKYTLKDIKDFSYARVYSSPLQKVTLFLVAFVCLVSLVAMYASGILVEEGADMVATALISVFPLFFILILAFLPGVLQYQIQKRNYLQSKLLSKPQCFSITPEQLQITSQTGRFLLVWKDVYKVKELRPCFMIYSSPGKVFMIPQRCFESEQQLELFRKILKEQVDGRKLSLKQYRLKQSMPDSASDLFGGGNSAGSDYTGGNDSSNAIINDSGITGDPSDIGATASTGGITGNPSGDDHCDQLDSTANNSDDEPSLLDMEFTLTKKDLLSFNFRLYYTMPGGLILTGIGVLLLFAFIRSLVDTGTVLTYGGIMGAFLIFFIPLALYWNISRQFSKDTVFQKPYRYRFFLDYYLVDHPTGANRIYWNDLVKIKETKNAYLFFVTKQIAHVVPKRILDGRNEDLRLLKELVENNKPGRK